MSRLSTIECQPPWLIARFADRQRVASWSLNRPGIVEADTVAWLQVFDADLPLRVDPLDLLERRLADRGLSDAVGLMTAREIRHHHFASSIGGGVAVEALVTLGLTNGAELDATGYPADIQAPETVGTINTLVALSRPLSDGAIGWRPVSIATMARTAVAVGRWRKGGRHRNRLRRRHLPDRRRGRNLRRPPHRHRPAHHRGGISGYAAGERQVGTGLIG